MKKLFSITASSAVILLVSACSGSPQVGAEGPGQTAPATSAFAAATPTTPPAAAPTTDPAAAAPSTAPAAAPASDPAPDPATAEATAPQPAAPPAPIGPNPQPSPTPLEDLGLNARGNMAQKVGETSVFGAPTGQQFADLTAEDIQTNFKCTSAQAQPSINGQYIAIKIKVAVHANFPDSGWPSLGLSNQDFTVWDAAGTKLVDPIGNSGSCIPRADLVSSPIDPGETASGLVVLDVPQGAGSAAFIVGGFEGSYGWEWHW